jgi:hypothetical protein
MATTAPQDEYADLGDVEPAGDEFADLGDVEQPAEVAEDPEAYKQLPSQQPKYAKQRDELAKFGVADDDPMYKLLDRIDKIGRPLVRGITETAEGVLALPKLIVDLPANASNALLGTKLPTLSSQPSLTDVAGVAPKTNEERLASGVARSIGGALTGIGAGESLATNAPGVILEVGKTLAANPVLQTVGAVTSPVAADVTRELGGGQTAQTAAALAGGVAPTLATAGAVAGVRGAFRGGETGRQTVARNVETFERAGTTPTVGQATEGRIQQATETALSRAPGGAGKIISKAEKLAEDLAANIEAKATRLAGRTSAETTGRKISAAITGQGGFTDQFASQKTSLYNVLDRLVPADSPATVTNTQSALKRLTQVDPGAPATTARLVNPKIKQIADDIASDAATGAVPYSALKELRTRIGEQLDSGLVSDVPQKQWKALYGALSEDLRAAARAAGPAAERAFNRANNYTRAGYKRLEVLDDVVQKAGGPESVFKAATSGTAEGATKLRAVMQSLDDDGRRAVSATVLRRLGRSINSQQDELGERFSTETFLTSWNKLSPEAKKTLFGRFGDQYSKDIDAISKVASNLRKGSKVYANPSGTGQATTQAATVAAVVTAAITGDVGTISAVGSTIAGSNMLARLMTNPKFVRWLAVSTRLPASAFTAQLNGLAQMAQRNKDPELFEAVELLKDQENQIAQTTNKQDETDDRL